MSSQILSAVFICVLLAMVAGCGKSQTEGSSSFQPSSPSSSHLSPAGSTQDVVLVTVNNHKLTRSMATRIARDMARRQGVPPQFLDAYLAQAGEQMEQMAVEQFIDETLGREEAERRNEPVSDSEIDAVVSQLASNLPPGLTLETALAAQGATLEDLRKDIASSERLRKLYEAETAGVEPASDEQVADFYRKNIAEFTTEEMVGARHILIECKPDADEATRKAAKAEAEALRQQLVEGADFAELAKAKSACPSRNEGGNLGLLQKGRTVPEFDEAAFSQEVGEIGPVVETPFGHHIIQVTNKVAASTQSLDEVSDEIRDYLTRRARNEKFGAFLKTLRKDAVIVYAGDSQKQ